MAAEMERPAPLQMLYTGRVKRVRIPFKAAARRTFPVDVMLVEISNSSYKSDSFNTKAFMDSEQTFQSEAKRTVYK